MRWRRDFFTFVTPAGPDFVAALRFTGSIPPVADYADALVTSDTPATRPELTMQQMRQQALLSVISATLPPDGDSVTVIRGCVHAGGVVQIGGVNHDQALIRLDKRWGFVSDAPDVDLGDEARKLHSMLWPSDFSVDSFATHFNLAVSRASKIHQNPLDDNDPSMEMRKSWWYVIASPPVSSLYFAAAQEARAVTGQNTTLHLHIARRGGSQWSRRLRILSRLALANRLVDWLAVACRLGSGALLLRRWSIPTPLLVGGT